MLLRIYVVLALAAATWHLALEYEHKELHKQPVPVTTGSFTCVYDR